MTVAVVVVAVEAGSLSSILVKCNFTHSTNYGY